MGGGAGPDVQRLPERRFRLGVPPLPRQAPAKVSVEFGIARLDLHCLAERLLCLGLPPQGRQDVAE